MLQVTRTDLTRCGGFLAALADRAAQYVWETHHDRVKWLPDPVPQRLIVHKAPHLDDYVGEFLFRAAMPPPHRQVEYFEMALMARDDSSATMLWPDAAVFGIGNDLPCGASAGYLFDEHVKHGPRTFPSCAHVVARCCFDVLPSSLSRVLEEVGEIDRAGGAHPLHLNNLLKTVHQVHFSYGQTAEGQTRKGKLSDEWKRALVNALVTAVVYCLDHNINFIDSGKAKAVLDKLFRAFVDHPPFEFTDRYERSLKNLRSNVGNIASILKTARVPIEGSDEPQFLVLPFLAVAAAEAWGDTVSTFLMTHFIESEILKNVDFDRVSELVGKCLADPRKPRPCHTAHCSVTAHVVHECRFHGKVKRNGRMIDAQFPSLLWIVGCRHNNGIIQPHKALAKFVSLNNWGVGLLFMENTKECNKVIFRGQHVPDAYWNRLVTKIEQAEPGLWMRPSEASMFLLNGNPAHQYVPLSKLTPTHLARLCRTVKP